MKTLITNIGQLATPGFWEAVETRQAILSRLPEYRLSKFQRALPEQLALEMVGSYLLDIPAAQSWVAGRVSG